VNRGVYILADNAFVEQNRVLVVITLPCHKADESVLSYRNLAAACSGTVRKYLTRVHPVPLINNRSLIDTRPLIGTLELHKPVRTSRARSLFHKNLVRGTTFDDTVLLRYNANARVNGGFVFHPRPDNRRLCFKERNSLPLHVGTHQCAVCVVVFEKRNK